MATAKKDTREVQRTDTENVIVLTLSEAEAAALVVAVGSVDGDRYTGPRKHTSDVYDALRDAGVPMRGSGSNPFADLLTGTLHSKPEPAGLKAGDRIRILKDSLASARVSAGDVLTVKSVDPCGQFTTDAPTRIDGGDCWFFELSDEGTGWERVTEPAPLKRGDTLRITRHSPNGENLRIGDRVTVVDPTPDYDDEIEVRSSRNHYLKASGSDKGWERADG